MKRKLNRNIYNNLFSKQADGRYFIKMHGLENHFVIFDGRKSPYLPDEDEIKRVCDNNLGVGADQFIILNLAMGGSWFTIDPDFKEAAMEIDYVRVYKN